MRALIISPEYGATCYLETLSTLRFFLGRHQYLLFWRPKYPICRHQLKLVNQCNSLFMKCAGKNYFELQIFRLFSNVFHPYKVLKKKKGCTRSQWDTLQINVLWQDGAQSQHCKSEFSNLQKRVTDDSNHQLKSSRQYKISWQVFNILIQLHGNWKILKKYISFFRYIRSYA